MSAPSAQPRSLRIIVGEPPCVEGVHAKLACAAADRARALGLAAVKFERSTNSLSHSFYLTCRDALDRKWIVRISEHLRPRRTRVPQVDVVSRDGLAGREQLLGFVDAIAQGELLWFEADGTETRRPQRRAPSPILKGGRRSKRR